MQTYIPYIYTAVSGGVIGAVTLHLYYARNMRKIMVQMLEQGIELIKLKSQAGAIATPSTPETVETVGQAMEKEKRDKIMQIIVCAPDDWHNSKDLALEVGLSADIVEAIIKKEPARYIKSRYNTRIGSWEFQIVSEHMYDMFPTA